MQKMLSRSTFRAICLGVSLSVVATFAHADDAFVIISDVDDTVKITNVLNRSRAVRNAIRSELVFAGMPELYRQMLGPDSRHERLRFISGSPRVLAHEIRELLAESKFPSYDLTVRGFRELRLSALHFKTKWLNGLYGAADEQFILIGDDTEADPEAYAAFAASRPAQVIAIYIRRITGRPLPPAQVSFVTAYDIAVHERIAGRLTHEQATAVGSAVLSSSSRILLPAFQTCPTQFESIPDPESPLLGEILRRLQELCGERTSGRARAR